MTVVTPSAETRIPRAGDADAVERRTLAIGRELFASIGRGPSVLDRGWWDDRMMGLTLADPAVKVQLFRFIDALPALTSPEAVVEHLADYLQQAGDRVPWWLGAAVELAPVGTLRGELLAFAARFGAGHMARRFIAGSTPTEAFRTVQSLRRRHLAFTADLLGEAVISEAEADAYQGTCLEPAPRPRRAAGAGTRRSRRSTATTAARSPGPISRSS